MGRIHRRRRNRCRISSRHNVRRWSCIRLWLQLNYVLCDRRFSVWIQFWRISPDWFIFRRYKRLFWVGHGNSVEFVILFRTVSNNKRRLWSVPVWRECWCWDSGIWLFGRANLHSACRENAVPSHEVNVGRRSRLMTKKSDIPRRHWALLAAQLGAPVSLLLGVYIFGPIGIAATVAIIVIGEVIGITTTCPRCGALILNRVSQWVFMFAVLPPTRCAICGEDLTSKIPGEIKSGQSCP